MKNQNKINSILEISLLVLSCVIIVVGVFGCKKKEPIREDTSSIELIEQKPSIENVSSEGNLSKQTKIAFASNRDGNYEIYVMNADGSEQKRVTDNPRDDSHPSWSPDGKKIAFRSNRDISYEIYVMNADGSEQKSLTFNIVNDSYPSWSPDGRKIAFSSRKDGPTQIYVMDINGNESRRLTYDSKSAGPCWSPDGKKIAFGSNRDGNYEIYVMNADGSEQKRLTDNTAVDMYPSWSPDGKKIAFVTLIDGNYEIYIMNADGSEKINLTNNTRDDSHPSWSPDGKKIAFSSNRDGNYEIYVMNADGSEQKRLTNISAMNQYPSWSPFLSTESISSDDNLYSQSHKTVIEGEETSTAGGEPIIVDTEVIWRIAESQQSFSADHTLEEIENVLRSRVRNTNNMVIGRHYFVDFLNEKGAEIKFDQTQSAREQLAIILTEVGFINSETTESKVNRIQDEMLAMLRQDVSDPCWGIEIEKVFIKQVRLSEEVQRRLLEPIESEIVPVKSVEEKPREKSSSERPVSLDGRLYKQSKIAFVSEKDGNLEVYVVNVDGSGLKNLTNNPARDLDPSWSPDGKKIAFRSYRPAPETYVMNADGSEQTRLTDNSQSGSALGPASWSPDGTKIAFDSLEEARISGGKLVRIIDIYVANIDGSEQKRLTNNSAEDERPSWSPDGKKIAFRSNRDGNLEIYVMNADGSEQKRLTNNPAADGDPTWSPDGKMIAFWSVGNRLLKQEIYVMNADGSGLKKVADYYWMDRGLPWSPDGKMIVFESRRDRNQEIYVMNADGSALTNLTNNPAVDALPSWSPDGKKIAFVSGREDERFFEVYVMNADGSDQRRLTDGSARREWLSPPAWSPFLSTANVSSDDN